MPIASGAGHWPREHLVEAAVTQAAKSPSNPSYVQSYMPQWVPPNKILPPKQAFIIHGPNQPGSPSPPSFHPRNSYPNKPENGPPTEIIEYDTPPPRYSSPNPRDGGPGSPRNGTWSRNPNPHPKPPRFMRGSEKYGAGHHRFGQQGTRPGTRPDFGHNKYGVQYNNSRQVISTSVKGGRPVGPKGLESYEVYGPRMNMSTGVCGPQMRPLCAMLGGLLALAALGGVIAGITIGAKSLTTVKKFPFVYPLGSVRYYRQNGGFEPCFDRYATTTKTTTTTTTTTTPKSTTTKPTTTTTQCVPVTINIAPDPPAPTISSDSTETTKLATTRTTTICIITSPRPTTPLVTTIPATTTTIPTTTPPLTTQTTLPFCDTLTTSFTLVTMNPIPTPYSGAPQKSSAGVGLLFLILAFATRLLVD